jgi:hypothetical protein
MIGHGHYGVEIVSHVESKEEAHRFLDYLLASLGEVKVRGLITISLEPRDGFLPGALHQSCVQSDAVRE